MKSSTLLRVCNASKHMKTTKNNPWAAMDAIVNANPEPTGEEWFTVDQFAERYKLSRAGADGRLRRLMAGGILDRWKGVSGSSSRTNTKWRVKPV